MKRVFTLLKLAACPLVLSLLSNVASATTYFVSSIPDLNAKIAIAVAGDTIVVSNGVYTTSASITVNKVGTAANPITIRAETVGGVEIAGTHGISMGSSAAYIIVQGFKLTHAAAISIPNGSSHCRYSRNIVQLTIPAGSDVSYFNISGNDAEIDRNELRNKSTLGEMLDIAGSGGQVARRLWVHHNYFHDFTSPGGNGAETIRWGLSGLSLSTGDGICEYNLFLRCNGENEMISNKSSGNTYRYNTVLDGREISQRHGNDCLYYGNYMRNSEGIRVYGDRHKIFGNYFESNSIGVNMGNGDGDVYNGAALTAHDRPDDNVVVFNTFFGNSTHYQMGGRTGGLGSSNTVVANNIFQGGGSMASISSSGPYTGSWSNNIRWQTSSAGNMPASAYMTVNPLLVQDAAGVYHIQAGSPAIDAGVGANDYYGVFSSFPYVTADMDGQPRDASKDIGADEFSSAPVIARLLTTNDVGPFSTEGGMQFSLAVDPSSRTVMPGSNALYTVNVTALNGTTGVVALAVTGLPPGTSASFNPASVTNTGSSTLTLSASNSAAFGNYALTITGNASNVLQSVPATLTVGDFLLSAMPAWQAVTHGSNANYAVTLTTNSLFSGNVTFDVTGLPAGAGASFSPPSLSAAGSATMTVTTAVGVVEGSYDLTITGTGGSAAGSASALVTLNITGDVALPGTLFWIGTNNWSSAPNWTNVTAGGFGAPGISNDVVFTNLATVANSSTINSIIDSDTTINSLAFVNTNNTFHNLLINPGRTLAILGSVPGYQGTPALNVGLDFSPGTVERVHASISGAEGTLAIDNTNAAVQVRQGFGSGTVGPMATLDLSGLGTFTANLRRLQLGSESGNPRRVAGALYLARTNTITLGQALDVNSTNLTGGTPALVLGHNTGTGNFNTNGSALYLGINNSVFVNHIVAGRGNQTNNVIAFNPAFLGNNPTAYFRGSDGVSRVGQWVIGDNSPGSLTGPSSGTNDFTGGTLDAAIDRLFVGRGRNGTTANAGIGTFTFDAGTVDVNTLRLGTMVDEGSSTNASGVGTANVNGSGTLIVNTVLELAHTNVLTPATASAIASTRGTLNVNGGSVLANRIVAAGGASTINISAGTLVISNTAGTPPSPVGALNLTNALLHLKVDAGAIATNIVANGLAVAGVNQISIGAIDNATGNHTFPLVAYGTLNGSVAANFVLDVVPPGYNASLVDNAAENRIDLVIAPLPPPVFGAIGISGSNVVLAGSGGAPNAPYCLLTSTNITLPVGMWMVSASNVFDANGNFSITNTIDPDSPQRFFRLQLP